MRNYLQKITRALCLRTRKSFCTLAAWMLEDLNCQRMRRHLAKKCRLAIKNARWFCSCFACTLLAFLASARPAFVFTVCVSRRLLGSSSVFAPIYRLHTCI